MASILYQYGNGMRQECSFCKHLVCFKKGVGFNAPFFVLVHHCHQLYSIMLSHHRSTTKTKDWFSWDLITITCQSNFFHPTLLINYFMGTCSPRLLLVPFCPHFIIHCYQHHHHLQQQTKTNQPTNTKYNFIQKYNYSYKVQSMGFVLMVSFFKVVL